MATALRLATFNIENWDDEGQTGSPPPVRIQVLRPMLERLGADVLCLQEVHGQEVAGQPRGLRALQQLFQGTPYANYHVAHTKTTNQEAYNERNLVVVSRFPITHTEQIKHEITPAPKYQKVTEVPAPAAAENVTWERPVFYIQLNAGLPRPLHLVNLHLKSRIPTNVDGQQLTAYKWRTNGGWAEGFFLSSLKRVGQAVETRMLLDRIFDQDADAHVAVCGDFNADLLDVPTQAIRGDVENTGNPDLLGRVLIPCEHNIPETRRYSLFHQGRGLMYDHVLASRALLRYFRHAEVHNEVLHDESMAFADDKKYPEPDHAPVVAEFVLP